MSVENPGVYGVYALLVEKYISARNADMLPDVATEEALGMKGQPAGRNLYGAFKTLYLHGRFSRTLIEQALAYSPTSYPEYIQLYLRSLPPAERSMYAADLYNSNFAGIHWDSQLYQNCFEKRGNVGPPIKPAEPLGDNRHEPRQASAIQHALEFHALLNCQYLLDEDARDVHSPLNPEYVEMMGCDYDILDGTRGSLFGIDKSELVFGERSDTGRALTNSEVIVRTWNLLYYAERLSRTELECALIAGPDAIRSLFSEGVRLASMFFRKREDQALLEQASCISLDEIPFSELLVDVSVLQECDYCGEEFADKKVCSGCKIAMYCCRDHQKGDWKRHKPLCQRYKQASVSDS